MSDLNAYAIQVEALARRQIERIAALEAENANLRRQVELAKNNTQVTYEEMWGKYRCEFCGAAHKRERELVHHSDCPHAEAKQ